MAVWCRDERDPSWQWLRPLELSQVDAQASPARVIGLGRLLLWCSSSNSSRNTPSADPDGSFCCLWTTGMLLSALLANKTFREKGWFVVVLKVVLTLVYYVIYLVWYSMFCSAKKSNHMFAICSICYKSVALKIPDCFFFFDRGSNGCQTTRIWVSSVLILGFCSCVRFEVSKGEWILIVFPWILVSSLHSSFSKCIGGEHLSGGTSYVLLQCVLWMRRQKREESNTFHWDQPKSLSYHDWLSGRPCIHQNHWVTVCLGFILGKRISWSCNTQMYFSTDMILCVIVENVICSMRFLNKKYNELTIVFTSLSMTLINDAVKVRGPESLLIASA